MNEASYSCTYGFGGVGGGAGGGAEVGPCGTQAGPGSGCPTAGGGGVPDLPHVVLGAGRQQLPRGGVGPDFGGGGSEGLLRGRHGCVTVPLIHNVPQHVKFLLLLPDLTPVVLLYLLSLFFLC